MSSTTLYRVDLGDINRSLCAAMTGHLSTISPPTPPATPHLLAVLVFTNSWRENLTPNCLGLYKQVSAEGGIQYHATPASYLSRWDPPVTASHLFIPYPSKKLNLRVIWYRVAISTWHAWAADCVKILRYNRKWQFYWEKHNLAPFASNCKLPAHLLGISLIKIRPWGASLLTQDLGYRCPRTLVWTQEIAEQALSFSNSS